MGSMKNLTNAKKGLILLAVAVLGLTAGCGGDKGSAPAQKTVPRLALSSS